MSLITWFVTWDSGILTALGLLLAYSLLISRHKSLVTLISVYVAYVMATAWSDHVVQFFAGNRVFLNQFWIQANYSPYLVQSVLMVVLVVLLAAFLKLGGKRARFSALEVVLYSLCSMSLILVFLLSFMTPPQHEQVMTMSHILPYVDRYREWILGVPVFIIIFFGLYGNEE